MDTPAHSRFDARAAGRSSDADFVARELLQTVLAVHALRGGAPFEAEEVDEMVAWVSMHLSELAEKRGAESESHAR
jgi:hypothetical protein